MELIFNYGFSVNNMDFGYNETGLYRLPQMRGNRFYPLKKLNIIEVGKQNGYRLYRREFSVLQLKSLLHLIDPVKIYLIEDKICPF